MGNEAEGDPAEVSRLGGIEIVARGVVEGFLAGLHRSPFRGFSVEFTEHRPYQPGDEPRYLDWKILARSDRLFIKQYEEETNLRAMVLVDASRSMAWRGSADRLTKRAYADRLAAALGLILLPAVASSFWAREVWSMSLVAAPMAFASAALGLLVSFHAGLPSGPLIAAGRFADVQPVDRKRTFWRTMSALCDAEGARLATATIVFRGGPEYSERQIPFFRSRTDAPTFGRMFPNYR